MQVELAEKDHQKQLMIEAQLDALMARINPHFLFNTLNTIGMLIRTDPEKARELLLNFSAFFRNSLKGRHHFIPLSQEMDNVNNYLVLEKARFGDKINIETNIDEELLEVYVPLLCIQPLIENAIIHGITPKEGNGIIKVSAHSLSKDYLEISVSDDGMGIPADILPLIKKQEYSSGSGAGVGLYNVDRRLRMLFGDESSLIIESEYRKGTTVRFIIKKCFNNEEVTTQ